MNGDDVDVEAAVADLRETIAYAKMRCEAGTASNAVDLTATLSEQIAIVAESDGEEVVDAVERMETGLSAVVERESA